MPATTEFLEPRRLFAVTFTADSALTITGDDNDNVIDVSFNTTSGNIDVTADGALLTSVVPTTLDNGIVINAGAGDDTITYNLSRGVRIDGGAGDDNIRTAGGRDTIYGGAGADTLDGGSNGDILLGDGIAGGGTATDDADDLLYGRSGDDRFESAGGSDTLDGGGGSERDLADYRSRSDDLNLSLDGVANDGATGETGQLLGIEDLLGGSGDDTLTGSGRAEAITGNGGNDSISGFGGDDILAGGGGRNTIDGGSGDDIINLDGTDSDDSAGGVIYGRSGDDEITAFVDSTDSVSVYGGSGDDRITADDFQTIGANHEYYGEGGDDFLFNGKLMDGGSGNDSLTGTVTLRGGAGNDTLQFGVAVLASGGGGTDTVRLLGSSLGLVISLDGVANDGERTQTLNNNVLGDLEIFNANDLVGPLDFDGSMMTRGITVRGGLGDDTLRGGSAADLLEGFNGDDELIGNAGEDVLRGQRGNDTLTGGAGPDSFNGGFGNDRLNSDDGVMDLVNGAQGLGDVADTDNLDTVLRVETIV